MRRTFGLMASVAGGVVALYFSVSAARAGTIYVDNKLTEPCKGTYSVSARDGTGKDGDAYKTVVEAANVAKAGDIVLIREGVYKSAASVKENDVLWPKNSGFPGSPITFKAYQGETVVLGEGGDSYPGWDDRLAISGGTITLKGVSYIVIEDLQVRKVTGWAYARKCDHVTVRNCAFADGLHGYKGTFRMIECNDFVIAHCTFENSGGDSLSTAICERNVIEDCAFNGAAHCLLAVRGSSFNVVRNCRFENREVLGHLTETYDVKVDRNDPSSPVYTETPAYDSTRHNLYERNLFGLHPCRPGSGAQPCAMEYSGQESIIRGNLFWNPPTYRDPQDPGFIPGGPAIGMRWGGSWDGWNANKKYWVGEGIEGGYVTGNRFYNNTFYGYDNACVTIPPADAMKNISLNPPPMDEHNPPKQFSKKYAFEDNEFINNIFAPGIFQAHVKWGVYMHVTGRPIAVLSDSESILPAVRFLNNDFFGAGEHGDELLYFHKNYQKPATPAEMDKAFPGSFQRNLEQDPMFTDPAARNFALKEGSPMIDAGAFLTTAVGAGKDSTELIVKDAEFFYDGFGIPGEKGDLIQFQGQKDAVRVVAVDYKANSLKLDKPLSWQDGEGVALPYAGAAPDIGAFQHGPASDQAVGPRAAQQPGSGREN